MLSGDFAVGGGVCPSLAAADFVEFDPAATGSAAGAVNRRSVVAGATDLLHAECDLFADRFASARAADHSSIGLAVVGFGSPEATGIVKVRLSAA